MMLGADVRGMEGKAGVFPLIQPWLQSECCDTDFRMILRLLLPATSRAELSVSLLFTEKKHMFLPCFAPWENCGIVIVIHRRVDTFEHETISIRAVETAQLIQHLQEMGKRDGRILEAHESAGLVRVVVKSEETASNKVGGKDQLPSLSSDLRMYTVA